jgi:hypothetical protein
MTTREPTMTITDLISALEDVRATYGDMPVLVTVPAPDEEGEMTEEAVSDVTAVDACMVADRGPDRPVYDRYVIGTDQELATPMAVIS